ncbi:hypothetical protein AB7C87_18700 [Natrarchaeobius sp. A-rgal3]|uniref:hypothetical protein n=1 Tax=Natrarchaeobius versutus TaxID=1679078 RepID=UPI0035106AE5
MNNGILYMATGDKYINETKRSVTSLRNHMPDIPVTLVTDQDVKHEGIDDVIIKDDFNYDYRDSITNIEDTPYERTLQLDSDTYICGEFHEIFDVLDEFDLGISVNPGKTHFERGDNTYVSDSVPKGFPVFNSGVMLFRNNIRVRSLFEKWRRIYADTIEDNPRKYNQPALWEALYTSDVRLFPLPREYNCFILFSGCVSHEVKIIHGRHPEQERIAKEMNEFTGPRCYDKSKYPIRITRGRFPGNERIDYRIRKSVGENGIKETVKMGLKRLFG